MNRIFKSLLAAGVMSAAAAGCATYDYGYGYSQPYAYGYDSGYVYDNGPYYDYGPGYYVGPPALGFYYYGNSGDHEWHGDGHAWNGDRHDWNANRGNEHWRGDGGGRAIPNQGSSVGTSPGDYAAHRGPAWGDRVGGAAPAPDNGSAGR